MDFTPFRIITFDCFGTLIDWENGILSAIRPVIERYGVVADDREILEEYARIEAKHEEGDFVDYRMVLRFVMAEMSFRFGFDAEPAELDCLTRSIGSWDPFPDTIGALKRLRNRFKLAIVSNVDDALFEKTAERLEVAFDWIVTAQQAGAYKPSKRVFDRALKTIDRPRCEILHVAQSLYHDIAPAKELGLSTVWVNRRTGKAGFGATPAASATPDLEVPDLATLIDLIEM